MGVWQYLIHKGKLIDSKRGHSLITREFNHQLVVIFLVLVDKFADELLSSNSVLFFQPIQAEPLIAVHELGYFPLASGELQSFVFRVL